MAGLLKAMKTASDGGRMVSSTECLCGWKSRACTSRSAAVALHKQHVSEECPIGKRRPLPDSFKRSTG